MAQHSNGLFGVIPSGKRPLTQRHALVGGRRRLRTAGANLDPYEILGGRTVVSALVANGNFVLPTLTGATGLIALGGLRIGDRLDYVLQNDSVNAAGTATLVIDAGATFTLYGPLLVPAGATLYTRIVLNTATTALCYTNLVGASGALVAEPFLGYVDAHQNAATGSTSLQGAYATTVGAIVLTAAQVIGGYTLVTTEVGNVTITWPGAAVVQAALLAKGVTSAAGLRLPPVVLLEIGNLQTLTVTAGAGETVRGTAIVDDTSAEVHYVFSGAATADIVVVHGA